MSDGIITHKNYQDLMMLDFKSILAFVVVIETRSLYGASVILKCSQPAVSIYLKRARNYFIHPLFTREGRNLIPTEYALQLSAEIRPSMAVFYDVLSMNFRNNLMEDLVMS